MPDYIIGHRIGTVSCLTACAFALLYGRLGAVDSSESLKTAARGANPASIQHLSSKQADEPIAFVDGLPLRWEDLRPSLIEMSGVEALGETVLDRRLATLCAERNISIEEADIEKERLLLRASLSTEANEAVRLMQDIRQRQGLGEYRFAALLRRNAMLRRLVADSVSVDEDAARTTFELMHGEKRTARVIVVDRLGRAEDIRGHLDSGESFIDLAVQYSTDSSAARGGLLEPVSRADPSWPAAFRSALWQLKEGEVSKPVLLNDRFALLQLVSIQPPSDVSFDEVRPEMLDLARRNHERVLMEEFARTVLRDARMTIVDDTLNRLWNTRGE